MKNTTLINYSKKAENDGAINLVFGLEQLLGSSYLIASKIKLI